MAAPLREGPFEPPPYLRWPRSVWDAILRSDPCPYCWQQPAGTVDHVVPRAHGGRDVIPNIVGACATHNGEKQDRSLLLFMLERTESADDLHAELYDPARRL